MEQSQQCPHAEQTNTASRLTLFTQEASPQLVTCGLTSTCEVVQSSWSLHSAQCPQPEQANVSTRFSLLVQSESPQMAFTALYMGMVGVLPVAGRPRAAQGTTKAASSPSRRVIQTALLPDRTDLIGFGGGLAGVLADQPDTKSEQG